MPTLYTSVLRSNVIEPLESLLKSEFNKLPVFYDIDFKPRGNFFMRFIPMADELDQPTTEDQIRTYGLLMRLYRKIPGVYSRRNNLEQLMNYVDRIKRLIGNNSNYTVPTNGMMVSSVLLIMNQSYQIRN